MNTRKRGPRLVASLLSVLLAVNCLSVASLAFASEPLDSEEPAAVVQPVDGDTAVSTLETAESDEAEQSAAQDQPVGAEVEADTDAAAAAAAEGDSRSQEAADEQPKAEASDASDANDEAVTVQAEGTDDSAVVTLAVQNNVITSFEALLQDGSGPVGNVSQWQVFRMKGNFELPNGQVHAGDTTTITLPEKLKFNQTAAFDITDENGNVIGQAVIDGANKTVTITWTDFAETHSDVSGDFYFYVQIDRNMVDEAEDIPLNFDVSGNVVYGGDIHFIGIPDPAPYYMSKNGYQVQGKPRYIHFQIPINTIGADIQNAKLTDGVVNPGLTIDASSFRILEGTWVKIKGDWELQNRTDVTSNYTVQFSDDMRSFTLDMGTISASQGFYVIYDTVASYDLVDGEVIRNDATFTGNGSELRHISATATYFEAGGSAVGYVYAINVRKVDEDGAALAGAQFNVVRVANGAVVGTITTDASGNGSLSGLLKDDYQLVETVAPVGYTLLSEPVDVSAGSFDSNKTANVVVENSLERTSIPVSKVWVGPAAGSVTMRLMADGVETDSLVLSERNNWQGSFDDLPVYDPVDGHEITYLVTEDDVDGYSQEFTVAEDGSYVFTNTNNEIVIVNGTKTWDDADDQDGMRPESITVRLLADGVEIMQDTVGAEDDWSWEFAALPKYDLVDNHEIAYTVTEDAVEGYSPEYNGFNVTNKHTPDKTSVTVVKAWDDADNKDGIRPDQVTVRLLANGEDTGKSVVLNAENNWEASFGDLDLKAGGTAIVYTVAEDEVDGYTAVITGDAQTGFVITNTHEPVVPPTPPSVEKPTDTPKDTPKDMPKKSVEQPKTKSKAKPSIPKTGDDLAPGMLALGALAVAGAGCLVWARRTKRNLQDR
ncbi:Collagen adhesin precursor [Slackia heliotrinireducens]|uniref:Putative collagen-binding protein n=1 Tax=Slackia heliotrinireducens (strain ATCC 29202 / DSM 20476 / NCTC 11029 / RHS 1) TaxID=471855 RepID=C7N333_SLAHD|nr:Cna B-type domain-containing protein [Slackia heliotrinireducens]ACV21554.1 putative collagen-binding protein [Slackia heliotrinireducens DSM 20476]VEG99047.1 Collagen adhesin precursor [Slackia heliotrinireducens]